jgi:cold shock CspA family protein
MWGDRGFGWIKPDEPGPNIWFHKREIWHKQDPQIGQRVRFVIRLERGSYQACRISIMEEGYYLNSNKKKEPPQRWYPKG